jgi:hypothetical protein
MVEEEFYLRGIEPIMSLNYGRARQEGKGTGSCTTAGLSSQGLWAFASVLSHIIDRT